MIRLYLFGAPRLERDGLPVTTDTKKAIALLAYLAVSGRGHTRDTLAALLWGDADEQHARGALRRTLSVLRAAAGDAAVETSGDLVSVGDGVWCDVVAFRVALAAQGSGLAEVSELAAAPFMAGFNLRDAADFEEWQFLEGEALNRELAAALAIQAAQLAREGGYAAAIEVARRLLALDTLNEEAHRLLMRLHAFKNDQAAALRQYRECARVLDQELGVPPLRETTELYHAIRENRLARPVAGIALAPSAEQEPTVERTRAPQPLALVGRRKEWSTLMRVYEREAATGYCVALEGEAGIGKTRLADELIGYARARGATVASGRCFEGETGVAYGVVIQVLRGLLAQAGCADRLADLPAQIAAETARLLPELETGGAHPSPAVSDPLAAARFLDGLFMFLTHLCPTGAPTVLFFDDLHWADAASLDFITFLVRRLAGHSMLILLAWRTDGSPAIERLHLLLAELARRQEGVLLPLQRLQLADVVELTSARLSGGRADRQALAERLHRESEGVPLFLAAYVEVAQSATELVADHLPPSIRDLLLDRLAPISDGERQLLQAAAVLGRSFDLDTLQATSGRSAEETMSGVEQLAARGLIHEAPTGDPAAVYDFDHDKLRSLVYETTGAARRRLLHERAAHAWLAPGSRRRSTLAPAALAAYHFQSAGRAAEAIEQHLLAASRAEQVYANGEALQHYRAALALGYVRPGAVYEAIGRLEALRGDYGAALIAYEAAGALLREDAVEAGRLEHKRAKIYARLGEWEAAESCYTTAALALPERADTQRAALYADWALLAHQRGEAETAASLIECGLAAARAAGDEAALARASNILGVIQRRKGELDAAIFSLEASASLARRLGDAGAHAAALNNLALTLAEKDDLQASVELLAAALSDVVRGGDRHGEAAIRNNLADLLHALGREDEAMAELKCAVALFAEIGLPPEKGQAEIWKLTEW